MKVIKIFYGIGLVIIVVGVALMLTSKQAYINIGFLVGVIGSIILIIANGFEEYIKRKNKSDDEVKRGN